MELDEVDISTRISRAKLMYLNGVGDEVGEMRVR